MTELEDALLEAASALESCKLPYMLIEGLAVAAWGHARATLDVNLSVWAESDRLPETVACVCNHMAAKVNDPLRFVEDTRVLPLQSREGVRIDVIFGVLPLQREALGRAVTKEIAGRAVPVASIEDLLIMKLISERQKDRLDAEALVSRASNMIDRAYLLPKLEALAEALGRPDMLTMFREI